MGLKLITAATSEPVTLAEARAHLREPNTAEDALVSFWIQAARELAETYTCRRFITQTWDYTLDEFPSNEGEIRIPRPPMQSVTSVKYVDTGGTTQTLATSDYQVDLMSEFGRIAPAYQACWPITRCETFNAVTVRFVCGYGVPAQVPFSIKAAMLLVIGHLSEHREENSDFKVEELPLGAERLLHQYRAVRY